HSLLLRHGQPRSSFSCSWCGAPRDLHSFPTRRSSDLGDGRAAREDGRAARALPRQEVRVVLDVEDEHAPGRAVRVRRDAAREQRSEEHTSELQSRENLVCRLLLEKKKTKEQRKHVTNT